MILAHLPALQVVLPLLCAPFCLLFRWSWFSYGVAFVASWLTFAISIELLMIVLASGPITYHMGGWPPPFGIEYVVDTICHIIDTEDAQEGLNAFVEKRKPNWS